MKTLSILFMGLLAAVVVSLSPGVSRADYDETSGISGFSMTHELNDYTLGVSGPNFCKVENISARSLDEAASMPKKDCEKCMVSDLTRDFNFAVEAPWEIAPKAEEFCGIHDQPVSGIELSTYTLGVSGPNFCKVENVSAESYGEAIGLAKKGCEKCIVSDLTRDFNYGEAPWEITPRSEKFCES